MRGHWKHYKDHHSSTCKSIIQSKNYTNPKQHCKRCHAVTSEGRINSIGSTPSFFVLRTLPDWSERFEQFYVLNPHPAFTQIAEVTPPFAQDRPPPIVPVEMTLGDLEAIVAYVAELAPADLGAPIQHQ